MNSAKRGALIVLEGVDRSGKSTQCKRLLESLEKKGIRAEGMVFPDRKTPTGRLISEYLGSHRCRLHDSAVHLLFSANRWENVDKMKCLLNGGVTLIVDRYSYSGIAFSVVKKGMDIEWCKQPETGLPKPDLVFLLDLSESALESRPEFGKERYETMAIQMRVADMFKSLVDNDWRVINADESPEKIHDMLLVEVLNKIKEVETLSLSFLDFNSK